MKTYVQLLTKSKRTPEERERQKQKGRDRASGNGTQKGATHVPRGRDRAGAQPSVPGTSPSSPNGTQKGPAKASRPSGVGGTQGWGEGAGGY